MKTVEAEYCPAYREEEDHQIPTIYISKQAWDQGEEMWRTGKFLQIEMGAYLLGRREKDVIFIEEYVLPREEKILSLKPEVARLKPQFVQDAVMGKMESILKYLQDHEDLFSMFFREQCYTNPQIAKMTEDECIGLDWEVIGLPFVLDLTFNYEQRVKEVARQKGYRVVGHAHSHVLTTAGKFYYGIDEYLEAERENAKEDFNEVRIRQSIQKQLAPSSWELKVIHENICHLDGIDPKKVATAQFLHFNPEVDIYKMTLDLAEEYSQSPSESFLKKVRCRLKGLGQ